MRSTGNALTVIAIGAAAFLATPGAAALADGHTAPSVVKRIDAKPWPVLRSGDSGDTVAVAQDLLYGYGYKHLELSDTMDAKTVRATIAFQTDHDLSRTGTFDAETWQTICDDFETHPLRQGDKSWKVNAVQQALYTDGDQSVNIDGRFGPQTTAAVKAFQKKQKIGVDGIVGPLTFRALVTDVVDS